MSESALHPSIVALVSLAANIASNHSRETLNKWLRGRIAALRGARSLAYLLDMWLRHHLSVSLRRNSLRSFSRSLRSVRLALHPARSFLQRFPRQGLCQVERLKSMAVQQAHIDAVVEIARHIRDEAGEKLDSSIDQAMSGAAAQTAEGETYCTPTASGQSCC